MPEILSYTRRVRSAMVCGMSSMDALKKGRVSLVVLVSMFSRFQPFMKLPLELSGIPAVLSR